MNNLILIGSGGHALSVIDIIESEKKYKIFGIINNNKVNVTNYNVIGNDNDLTEIKHKCVNAVIGIGHMGNEKARDQVYSKLKDLNFNLPSIKSPISHISKSSIIEEASIIMHHAVIGPKVEIGKNSIINTNSTIEHESIVGTNVHISTNVTLNGRVKIGDGTFIGSGTIIKQGVSIGKNCFIKMGSIIKNDIS